MGNQVVKYRYLFGFFIIRALILSSENFFAKSIIIANGSSGSVCRMTITIRT